MEEDFAADTFSVSEDSGEGEEDDDDDDANVESVMGQADDSSQVVDEKLWDGEEDGADDKAAEKYESGPGVDDKDPGSRELRGRDAAASDIDESGDLTDEMPERLSGGEESPGGSDDELSSGEAEMDAKDAFEEPTGIELDEKGRQEDSGEADMDEAAGSDTLDEQADEDVEDGAEDQNSVEDCMDLSDTGEARKEEESDGGEAEDGKDAGMDTTAPAGESADDAGKSEPKNDPRSEKGSADPARDSFAASQMPQGQWSNDADLQASFAPAPSSGMPLDSPSRKELYLPDSSGHGEILSVDEPERRPIEDNPPSLQRTAPNPYRSLGDAMEEWKERVKLSDGPQDPQPNVPDPQRDGVGDEYQFAPEREEGGSQTLGPAAHDQINQNIDKKDSMIEDHENEEQSGGADPMEGVEEDSEHRYMKRLDASASREQEPGEDLGKKMLDRAAGSNLPEAGTERKSSREGLGDLVSFESYSFTAEPPPQPEDPAADQPARKVEIASTSEGLALDPLTEWKRYERKTMRLSQELCEQLRLVMEPTLASKLQGDYKTGKRINMKKVSFLQPNTPTPSYTWLKKESFTLFLASGSVMMIPTSPPFPIHWVGFDDSVSILIILLKSPGDSVHSQPFPKGQDMAQADEAQQEGLSGGRCSGRLAKHVREPLRGRRDRGTGHHLPGHVAARGRPVCRRIFW